MSFEHQSSEPDREDAEGSASPEIPLEADTPRWDEAAMAAWEEVLAYVGEAILDGSAVEGISFDHPVLAKRRIQQLESISEGTRELLLQRVDSAMYGAGISYFNEWCIESAHERRRRLSWAARVTEGEVSLEQAIGSADSRKIEEALLERERLEPGYIGVRREAFEQTFHDRMVDASFERKGSDTSEEGEPLAVRRLFAEQDALQRAEAAAQQMAAEARDAFVTEGIRNAQTFFGLTLFLQEVGSITGAGAQYEAAALIEVIDRIRQGELTADHITQACGLRAKVFELMRGCKLLHGSEGLTGRLISASPGGPYLIDTPYGMIRLDRIEGIGAPGDPDNIEMDY